MQLINKQNEIIGFLFINKPAGITSRECINRLQKLLPKKIKIGHAGTLDKFATGLLIVGIGRPATRLFRYLMKLDKKYWVRAKLGEQTDTLDNTGQIINECAEQNVSFEQLNKVFDEFPKEYEQTPPMFSALKWQGERLSDMARSEHWHDEKLYEILQTKTKTVYIYALGLIAYVPPFITFDAHVSHGTYIRALADDLAQKCNSAATTYALKRTEIGPFKLNDAIDLDVIQTVDDIQDHMRPVLAIEQQLNQRQKEIKL